MKKYPVCSITKIGFLSILIFALLFLGFFIHIVFLDETVTSLLALPLGIWLGILGIFVPYALLIVYTGYSILFGLCCSNYSISPQGITVYRRFKTYRYSWPEFSNAGMVSREVLTRNGYLVVTLYIYFSKKPLTMKEEGQLVTRLRWDRNTAVYFEYREPLYFQLKEQIPPKLREDLEMYEALYYWLFHYSLTPDHPYRLSSSSSTVKYKCRTDTPANASKTEVPASQPGSAEE